MESQHYATRRTYPKQKDLHVGDAVVDGVLQGMCAGLFMLALFVGMGRLAGHQPLDFLVMLGIPGISATPAQGALVHIAISTLYGVVWSSLIVLPLRRWGSPLPSHWLFRGLAFGLFTWMVAQIAIQYWTSLSLLPWYALLIAHLGYGGTLGYLQGKRTAPHQE